MKIIAEIKSIVKEGKTLRVIETEKENKKKSKMKDMKTEINV